MINKIPKNIFVFIIARTFNPFEILLVKIWVILSIMTTNIRKVSIENIPIDDVIIKNQNENPAVTLNDLKRGEESFILNWIDECD